MAQEFLAARWPDRTWEYQAIKRVICLYIFATTMLIVWNNIPFDILTQIAGFLIANLAIAIMMAAAIYLNFKLPASYRHPRLGPHRRSALDRGTNRLSRRQRLGTAGEIGGLTRTPAQAAIFDRGSPKWLLGIVA